VSQNDQQAARSSPLTAAMMALGILLLLPGLCTLLYAGGMLVSDAPNVIGGILSAEPIMSMVLVVWIVCILVSCLGVWLLRRARARRS
jgi:hypothetical protein